MPEQPALACVRGVSCPISEKTRAIRVNHALIDINRKIQTGTKALPNFSRFSASRLMKTGIVEYDQPVGQLPRSVCWGAEKIPKSNEQTNEAANY